MRLQAGHSGTVTQQKLFVRLLQEIVQHDEQEPGVICCHCLFSRLCPILETSISIYPTKPRPSLLPESGNLREAASCCVGPEARGGKKAIEVHGTLSRQSNLPAGEDGTKYSTHNSQPEQFHKILGCGAWKISSATCFTCLLNAPPSPPFSSSFLDQTTLG